tara:strand:+ start:769 stop:1083 length:315 start_codon:yes stop_codon:yes gene_type:complete
MTFKLVTQDRHFTIFTPTRFDYHSHEKFNQVFESLEFDNCDNIDFDLSQTEFIDSRSIGMLLFTKSHADKHSVTVRLLNPQGQVKKMIEVSNFQEIFDIVDSES